MQQQSIQLEDSALGAARTTWRVGPHEKPVTELLGLWLSVMAYSWIAIFLIGLVTIFLALVIRSSAAGIPTILAGILLVPMLSSAAAAVRRRRTAAVLGYLQQAVRLNLPMPRLLAAAAFSEEGATRRRIIALKEELEIGRPLAEALDKAVPEMPVRTLGLIDLAEQTGGLAETLNRLVAEDLRAARHQRTDRGFAGWYPAIVFVMICLVMTLMDVFVAPKFVRIFRDFRIPLPAVFLIAQSIAGWIWVLIPVLVLGLLYRLGSELRRTIHRPAPVRAFRDQRDATAWAIPVFGTMVRDRNIADVCVALADSIRLGYPLDESLRRLGDLDLNAVLRRRVAAWADAMQRGLSPADAARQARMPKLLTGMLAAVGDNDGLADVFAFVGRFYTDRFLVRREVFRAAMIPIFTVVTGIIVAIVALSIFMPMQSLIDAVAR